MSGREAGCGGEERRAAPRYDAAALGQPMVCRVNPGHEVELVNVSAVGACVEAAFALLPGRPLQLHAHGRGRRAAIEARVTWCRVAAVMSGRGVRFTAGLAFMRWVDVTKELAAAPGAPAPPRVAQTHDDGGGCEVRGRGKAGGRGVALILENATAGHVSMRQEAE